MRLAQEYYFAHPAGPEEIELMVEETTTSPHQIS